MRVALFAVFLSISTWGMETQTQQVEPTVWQRLYDFVEEYEKTTRTPNIAEIPNLQWRILGFTLLTPVAIYFGGSCDVTQSGTSQLLGLVSGTVGFLLGDKLQKPGCDLIEYISECTRSSRSPEKVKAS